MWRPEASLQEMIIPCLHPLGLRDRGWNSGCRQVWLQVLFTCAEPSCWPEFIILISSHWPNTAMTIFFLFKLDLDLLRTNKGKLGQQQEQAGASPLSLGRCSLKPLIKCLCQLKSVCSCKCHSWQRWQLSLLPSILFMPHQEEVKCVSLLVRVGRWIHNKDTVFGRVYVLCKAPYCTEIWLVIGGDLGSEV